MSALLYYSYSSGLSEAEKLAIDKSVCDNRQAVWIFLNKVQDKSKVIVFSTTLGIVVLFSGMRNVGTIGLSVLPQAPIVILDTRNSYTNVGRSRISIHGRKQDKVLFLRNRDLPPFVYVVDERFIRNNEVRKLIKQLRGGSLTGILGSTVFFAMLYTIWVLSGGAEGFVTRRVNPGWGLQNNNIYNPPGLVRPADCGTQLYGGSPTQSLKTWEDRNQPNPKDRWFLVESRPELVMRRGQSKFKTKDHGALAGLPYTINTKGGTSTPKTEENVDIFMGVVESVVEDPNSIWFEEGTYQGNTTREVESINIYNEEKNRVGIFMRSTGEFITFCQPDEDEINDLEKTGNFGGQTGWFNGQAKNLPPQQNVENDFTPVNSFESDVMGMSPITSMNESSSPNQGFTRLNSFESDVQGVTPIDLDWQI